MDTSPKYILMSEKAEEIQTQCPLKEKQHYKWISASSRVNGVTIVLANFFYIRDEKLEWFDDNAIWLPRPDQSQEMLDWGWAAIINGLYEFTTLEANYNNFDSIDQCTLAFVMHEKYQKQWDEEKGEWTG